MDKIGYDAEWEVVNSKHHGVPQNRERVFIVGHLRGRGGREVFPIEGTSREDNVKPLDGLKISEGTNLINTTQTFGIDKSCNKPRKIDIANCIIAREDSGVSNHKAEGTAIVIPVLTPERENKRQNGRRFKEDGEQSFTLTAQDRHGVAISVQPNDRSGVDEIKGKEATKKGYAIADKGDSVNLAVPNSTTRRGRVGNQVAQTLDTSCNQGVVVELYDNCSVWATWSEKYNCYLAIRKLTPRECFRLQGWEDKYIERAEQLNSNNQLYKQAGNGVTVSVIKHIAERM